MTSFHHVLAGLLVIQLVGAEVPAPAAPPAGPPGIPATADPEKLAQQGFEPLFDGKTMDGWKKVGGTGEFKVENGRIIGFGQNIRGNTFLRTEKSYADFILVFEFRFADPAGSSGCQFRSEQSEPDGRVFGYKCEHDNNKDRSFTAGVYDEGRRKWLFPGKFTPDGTEDQFTAQGQRLFKWTGWNTMVIRCQGRHIQTWLNGEPRADFTDDDEENFTPEGFIALQVHGGKSAHLQWRHLFLRELPAVQ